MGTGLAGALPNWLILISILETPISLQGRTKQLLVPGSGPAQFCCTEKDAVFKTFRVSGPPSSCYNNGCPFRCHYIDKKTKVHLQQALTAELNTHYNVCITIHSSLQLYITWSILTHVQPSQVVLITDSSVLCEYSNEAQRPRVNTHGGGGATQLTRLHTLVNRCCTHVRRYGMILNGARRNMDGLGAWIYLHCVVLFFTSCCRVGWVVKWAEFSNRWVRDADSLSVVVHSRPFKRGCWRRFP